MQKNELTKTKQEKGLTEKSESSDKTMPPKIDAAAGPMSLGRKELRKIWGQNLLKSLTVTKEE